MNPTIVVIAYNRPKSLQRLLSSIAAAYYSSSIRLHISIDASDCYEVVKVAENFDWKFGEKIISVHTEHLGLKNHVLACGDLVEKYESIVVLEDDLVVAPSFYHYTQKALEFYQNDDKIAGISLYSYGFEEASFQPFIPLNDGADVHFIQLASSWGQAWTKNQWLRFKDWLRLQNNIDSFLPDYMKEWGENSWKKWFNAYLIKTDRFFIFPNVSLSTNFEELGTNASFTGLFQVPLQIGRRNYSFRHLSSSQSIYDAYFEMTPDCIKSLNHNLSEYQFDVSLYGTKQLNKKVDFRLVSSAEKSFVYGFESVRTPLIQNVVFDVKGNDFGLVKMDEVREKKMPFYRYTKKETDWIFNHLDQLLDFTCIILYKEGMDIEKTLNSIPNNRKVQCLIVGDPYGELTGNCENVKESGDFGVLLSKGLRLTRNKLVTWCVAGDVFHSKTFDVMATIFGQFSHLRWVKSVVCDNELKERWTKALFFRMELPAEFASSRGSFFRSDCVQLKNSPFLFSELIQQVELSILVERLFTSTSLQEVDEIDWDTLKSRELVPPFGMLNGFFRRAYFKRLPFFSHLYRKAERIPQVIRYDEINNSYYLNDF